jgi:hypothetical protein
LPSLDKGVCGHGAGLRASVTGGSGLLAVIAVAAGMQTSNCSEIRS